ncbi:sugar transferase [Autumnicola musiva]|uniref:Sugar transferase n=1 Tax=Autumnicola musiva TaxID=3075589 RepID=A0ABU3D7G4_9FLAO|nr:sugar transferase [Zunongwangia sp. F117]MDT0677476.1 sugar transferase [Zunongwangia sp. F117]
MYRRFIKPLMDRAIAFIALVILSPLLLIAFILLAFANSGKPFFFQERPGKNSRIFRIVKFKTMTDKRDEKGNLLSDSERLTAIGKIVRKSSIDEIPQLWNVLKGEMSLIGPRPLLPEYLPLYDDFQKRRHEVKPGITGWAAVNGRNSLNWDEKFIMDVWYVDHLSFRIDMLIIIKTIQKVILSEGVNAEGHSTMPRFSEYIKQKNRI